MIKGKKVFRIFSMIFVGVMSLSLSSCLSSSSSSDKGIITKQAQAVLAGLGSATKYYEVSEGFTTEGEVVLLTSQGGPLPRLKSKLRILPGKSEQQEEEFKEYSNLFALVHVHQAQTLPAGESDGLDSRLIEPSLDLSEPSNSVISADVAHRANLKSAAILAKVATHFQLQGKKVYLLAHSFGSFIALNSLVYYGNNFDKILFQAGRFKMPDKVVEAFATGCGGQFDATGATFTEVKVKDCEATIKAKLLAKDIRVKDLPTSPAAAKTKRDALVTRLINSELSEARLQANVGKNYIELLDNMYLGNMMIVHGKDRNVGKLSAEEIAFLTAKKVRWVENTAWHTDENGAGTNGHELVYPRLSKMLFLSSTTNSMPKVLETSTLADFRIVNFLVAPNQDDYKLLTGDDIPALVSSGTPPKKRSPLAYYKKEGKAFGTTDTACNGAGKYNIAVLFDHHTPRQVSYKLEAAFGDGPYSLFQTKEFMKKESKFCIQFGRLEVAGTKREVMREARLASSLSADPEIDLRALARRNVQVLVQSSTAQDLNSGRPVAVLGTSSWSPPSGGFNIQVLKDVEASLSRLEDLRALANPSAEEQRELRELEIEEPALKAQRTPLRAVADEFDDYFDSYTGSKLKEFDMKIYVSDGIPQGYADKDNNIVYTPSGEFVFSFLPSAGIHSGYFATTLVHEFGHIFGNLVDEYYAYEVSGSAVEGSNPSSLLEQDKSHNHAFDNNCFTNYASQIFTSSTQRSVDVPMDRFWWEDGTRLFYSRESGRVGSDVLASTFIVHDVLNPWTHRSKVPLRDGPRRSPASTMSEVDGTIANYDGILHAGCNGGKSFRATKNSIMRNYTKYHPLEWYHGWGPVNSFYLKENSKALPLRPTSDERVCRWFLRKTLKASLARACQWCFNTLIFKKTRYKQPSFCPHSTTPISIPKKISL